jgi:hypothetical protein
MVCTHNVDPRVLPVRMHGVHHPLDGDFGCAPCICTSKGNACEAEGWVGEAYWHDGHPQPVWLVGSKYQGNQIFIFFIFFINLLVNLIYTWINNNMKNTEVRLLAFDLNGYQVTNNVNVMLCNINIIMSILTVGGVSSLMRNKLYIKNLLNQDLLEISNCIPISHISTLAVCWLPVEVWFQ